MIVKCVFCFGTGSREMDIGDENDVEIRCDDCRGTGIDRDKATPDEWKAAIEKRDQPKPNE